MKLTALAAVALLTAGCNKQAEGNKNVVLEETQTTAPTDSSLAEQQREALYKSITGHDTETKTYPYKAMDGSRANVTFHNGKTGQPISIKANGKFFELDKKADGDYERNGVSVVVKGDSLTIEQDGMVIPLVYAR